MLSRLIRHRGILPVLLASLTALAASGCSVPSDPADPPVFGARADGSTIVVKIPLCKGDEISRVEVYDFDDVKHTNPHVVWWASEPTSKAARSGAVKLWTGEEFARHSARPEKSSIPPNIGVAYKDPNGSGRDAEFAISEVESAKLEPGKYWTPDGPMTAEQIDAQLQCKSE